MDNKIEIKKTIEFENWYNELRVKEQIQIDARLERIQNAKHFGDAKPLNDGLIELRWKNGLVG